jgi:hypothetical protein
MGRRAVTVVVVWVELVGGMGVVGRGAMAAGTGARVHMHHTYLGTPLPPSYMLRAKRRWLASCSSNRGAG